MKAPCSLSYILCLVGVLPAEVVSPGCGPRSRIGQMVLSSPGPPTVTGLGRRGRDIPAGVEPHAPEPVLRSGPSEMVSLAFTKKSFKCFSSAGGYIDKKGLVFYTHLLMEDSVSKERRPIMDIMVTKINPFKKEPYIYVNIVFQDLDNPLPSPKCDVSLPLQKAEIVNSSLDEINNLAIQTAIGFLKQLVSHHAP